MTKAEQKIAHDLKNYNAKESGERVKGTAADYITVYNDFIRGDGNYSRTYVTTLYRVYSCEYCFLLEVLAEHYRDQQQQLPFSA